MVRTFNIVNSQSPCLPIPSPAASPDLPASNDCVLVRNTVFRLRSADLEQWRASRANLPTSNRPQILEVCKLARSAARQGFELLLEPLKASSEPRKRKRESDPSGPNPLSNNDERRAPVRRLTCAREARAASLKKRRAGRRRRPARFFHCGGA
jgi:hypothetical protein